MSKIAGYKCDHCGGCFDENETAIGGINPTEDLYDKLRSYPGVLPHKTTIHYCMECYRSNVLVRAENSSNRKKDEEGYKRMLTEYRYIFFFETIRRYNQKRKTRK